MYEKENTPIGALEFNKWLSLLDNPVPLLSFYFILQFSDIHHSVSRHYFAQIYRLALWFKGGKSQWVEALAVKL